MIVTADRTKCCSSGQCVRRAPHLFGQDEADGTVVVLNPRPSPADRELVELAVNACPVNAIQLTD